MNYNFLFTHAFEELDSSLVVDVWYDSKTQTAMVSLNDDVYRYSNVPFADVEALVQADSVGRAFNGGFMTKGFKQKFGPGEYLGNVWNLDFDQRDETTLGTPGVVPKNLTYSENAVVSNDTGVRVSLGNPNTSATPPRVSLKPVVDDAVEAAKFTVHFESNGPKTYEVEGKDYHDAVAKLHEAADMLGVDVKVTGVFVHFV